MVLGGTQIVLAQLGDVEYGLIGAAAPTYPSSFIIDFFSPFATEYTTYQIRGTLGRSNTDSDMYSSTSRNIATTSIDGFEITTASAPTLAGTMTLYGVRDV